MIDFTNPTVIKAIYTLSILLIGFIVYKLLLKYLYHLIKDVQRYYKTKKMITYIYFIICVIASFVVWSEGFYSLSTYLGLLSAGIAIALKDLISNIAAFFFILARKPFEVGDRIEVSDISGDVIDTRLFQFTVMEIGNWVHADQSTGRIIHIPNNKIFTDPVANYSKGFSHIWNEIEVLLTFESDWEKAKKILVSIADQYTADHSIAAEKKLKEAAKKFMIFYNTLTPIVYTTVESDGVLLTLRYLTDPKSRRSSSERLWEEILKSFKKENDIELAYKTIRMIQK